jgi:hypothetical protein
MTLLSKHGPELHRLQTVFLSPLSTFPPLIFFLSESQRSMMKSHTVLDRKFPLSTQEVSMLDHDLEQTGTGEQHSVNASISMPIPVAALQQLPPSITERHTSDHDLEKSGSSDSEKTSISKPVPETDTLDIEHVPVQNDPRKWSSFRKVSYNIPFHPIIFFTVHFPI